MQTKRLVTIRLPRFDPGSRGTIFPCDWPIPLRRCPPASGALATIENAAVKSIVLCRRFTESAPLAARGGPVPLTDCFPPGVAVDEKSP